MKKAMKKIRQKLLTPVLVEQMNIKAELNKLQSVIEKSQSGVMSTGGG